MVLSSTFVNGLAITLFGILIFVFRIYVFIDSYKLVRKNSNLNTKPITKNPFFPIFLSFILPGLGHLYIRKIEMGLLYLLGYIMIIGIFQSVYLRIVIFIPYSVWVIYDIARVFSNQNNVLIKFPNIPKPILIASLCLFIVKASSLPMPFLKENIVKMIRCDGCSMEKTICNNSHLFVKQYVYSRKESISEQILKTYDINRGDIISIAYHEDDSENIIKRCIGLPGDIIEIINKDVFINNQKYKEAYAYHIDDDILSKEESSRDNYGPVKVPLGHYFVLGDNRDISNDSRYFGFVRKTKITGKAYKTYAPFQNGRTLQN